MNIYKCKRGIQFLFTLKLLVNASFSNDIYLISIASASLFTLTMFLKKNRHPILNYTRIILLLELCFFDVPFSAGIIASMNFKIKFKIIILIFYCTRVGLLYFRSLKILDWVFLGILFIVYAVYFYNKDRKIINSKTNLPQQRKSSYLNINSQTEQSDIYDIINYLPFGVCILDNTLTIINFNNKAKKYCASIKEQNFQQQLFMMIQKACLQQQQNSALKLEKPRSIFNSSDDYGSDFQLRRLQSFSQTRRKAISQSQPNKQFNNFSDIGQILNKFKQINVQDSCQSNSLKYKDSITQKIYEIKIFDIAQGQMVVLQNITKKETQLDLRERYRFQSMLINSFSHELRTPLNCSLSLLQTLQKQLKSDFNEIYLKPALISNKKLLHQINDILDFANFEAQTFQLRPSIFKLSTVISAIEDYFKAECEQKEINLKISSCDDTLINSDYDRIMQILVNLMNNSVKFTKSKGEIQFNIQKVGTVYQFEVFDTGCGISIDKLFLINKILQNQEVDFSRRGEEDYLQYVGLGLKVSSQIAKLLCDKGELNITSSLNQFTKGRFYVKDQKKYDESLTIPTDECIQEPYKSILKLKCNCINVLIVDDIPFNHMAFSTVLKYLNIQSESAYDGNMAIDMIRKRFDNCKCTYKIIFMDIDMPGIDGYQTTKEIYQFLQQKELNTSVIMCSAFDSKENIDYAYKAGMKDVLQKPIDTDHLKKILNKYYF